MSRGSPLLKRIPMQHRHFDPVDHFLSTGMTLCLFRANIR